MRGTILQYLGRQKILIAEDDDGLDAQISEIMQKLPGSDMDKGPAIMLAERSIRDCGPRLEKLFREQGSVDGELVKYVEGPGSQKLDLAEPDGEEPVYGVYRDGELLKKFVLQESGVYHVAGMIDTAPDAMWTVQYLDGDLGTAAICIPCGKNDMITWYLDNFELWGSWRVTEQNGWFKHRDLKGSTIREFWLQLREITREKEAEFEKLKWEAATKFDNLVGCARL